MENDPLAHYIPRRLDDPPKFLFWDWDVAMIAIFGIMFGIISGLLFTGMAAGALSAYLVNKAKGGKRGGFSAHLAYWFLGVYGFKKRTPPPQNRDPIG